jgi:hypothetical protein
MGVSHKKMKIAIVGGGIFGTSLALKLADFVSSVDLIESDSKIMSRASLVNQARLHTGMHYPRDFETARDALQNYEEFKSEFPAAIKEIKQLYGIARDGSKTSPNEFIEFANKLGLPWKEVPVSEYFVGQKVETLLEVPESTFDAAVLRRILLDKLRASRIKLKVNTSLLRAEELDGKIKLTYANGSDEFYDHVVFAMYANNKLVRNLFSQEYFEMEYQVCEVALGKIHGWENLGITIMDGDFWSVMPFGLSALHSLTSVVHTPIIKGYSELLSCQALHGDCGKPKVFSCGTCDSRPSSRLDQMLESFKSFYPRADFKYTESLFTLKAIPRPTVADTASRPTTIGRSKFGQSHLIFSGKIGSSLIAAKKIVHDIESRS